MASSRRHRAQPRGESELDLGVELLLGPLLIGVLVLALTRYGPRITAWIVCWLGGEEPTDLHIAPSRPKRSTLKAKPKLQALTPTRTRNSKAHSPDASSSPAPNRNGATNAHNNTYESSSADIGLKPSARAIADAETVDTARALQETVEWSEVTGRRGRAQRKAGKLADSAPAADTDADGVSHSEQINGKA
uniref:Uncharacterized protein n=1 Tax=Strombidinopsis acuminata TaxID=141414 RepID=A0A7S3RPS5_9SPIT|eukprot:scaffold23044_cov39-Tisochrysis_lutea.AAC.1